MKILQINEPGKCLMCYSCMMACARHVFNCTGPYTSALEVVFQGTEAEINICRFCKDASCAAVCPTGALAVRNEGGVNFNDKVCISCGECTGTCSSQSLKWHKENGHPLVCISCGICSLYCPREVLVMKEINSVYEVG